jgi:hypothetical protein
MKTDTKEPDHAREQGQAQYDSIREMVADLDCPRHIAVAG